MGYQSVVGGIIALDTETGTRSRPCQPAGRLFASENGSGVRGRKFRNPADAPADYPPFMVISALKVVLAGPTRWTAAKIGAMQSPDSSTNPLSSRDLLCFRSTSSRSLRKGWDGFGMERTLRSNAGKSSPERADTSGVKPLGAGWRSPRGIKRELNSPVCGTSEWCFSGTDPDREGSFGCLKLRSWKKTVYLSGSASGEAREILTPLVGAGVC